MEITLNCSASGYARLKVKVGWGGLRSGDSFVSPKLPHGSGAYRKFKSSPRKIFTSGLTFNLNLKSRIGLRR